MVKKPAAFQWVFFFMLAVMVSFPVQAAFLYGHSLLEFSAILNKISMINWMALSMMAAASYFALKASPWIIVLAPLTVAVVFWNNYVVGSYFTDFSLLTTMLGSLAFAFLFVPLLSSQARAVLRDPKKQWWARPKRYKTQMSATLNPFVGQTIHSYTFDISSSGAFISLDGVDFADVPQVGEQLRLSLNISSLRKIRCDAVIIRKTEPNGRYPQGLGVKFVGLDKDHQKTLKRFLNKSSELTL